MDHAKPVSLPEAAFLVGAVVAAHWLTERITVAALDALLPPLPELDKPDALDDEFTPDPAATGDMAATTRLRVWKNDGAVLADLPLDMLIWMVDFGADGWPGGRSTFVVHADEQLTIDVVDTRADA